MRDQRAKVLCPWALCFFRGFQVVDHVLLSLAPFILIADMSQPNKTLYIKNLNDQVKKDGQSKLKSQLYALFTPYGRIVDVVAIKNPKMRGQAFVVFQDLAGATAAMRAWDGELFYDKEMKIEYAKTRSHATRRIEEPGWDPLAEAKAKALGLGSRLKKEARQGDGEAMDMDDDQSSNPNPQQNSSVPSTYSAVTISSRLLCTNIPAETSQDTLQKLFQYPGFQSLVLTPPGQAKSAQVQFEQPDQAKVAREGLHGHALKTDWYNSASSSRPIGCIPQPLNKMAVGHEMIYYDLLECDLRGLEAESQVTPAKQPRPSKRHVCIRVAAHEYTRIHITAIRCNCEHAYYAYFRVPAALLTLWPAETDRQDSPTRRSNSQSQSQSLTLSSTTSAPKPTPTDTPQRRRFIFIRLILGIWTGLGTLWSLLPVAWKRVRHNFGLIALGSDEDDEEGEQPEEDEGEDDPLVARAAPTTPAVSPQRISFGLSTVSRRTNRSTYAKPLTPAVSERPLDDDDHPLSTTLPTTHEIILPSRPRAASTLLPNPLSTSLLTPSASALPSRAPTPPVRRQTALHKTKTLVLDLDETLIHSTSRPMHAHGSMGGGGLLGLSGLFGGKRQGGGHMIEVVLGGRSTLYHVYKRPFVDFFLRKVSSWYTLVIFTASMPEYADPVIDWLDAGRGMFSRRFFRESCTHLPNGGYSKDLSIIDQDLSRVCLIDNSPASYSINNANGIPIEGWISDPGDEALLDLLPVLDSLRFTSDVRHVLGLCYFLGTSTYGELSLIYPACSMSSLGAGVSPFLSPSSELPLSARGRAIQDKILSLPLCTFVFFPLGEKIYIRPKSYDGTGQITPATRLQYTRISRTKTQGRPRAASFVHLVDVPIIRALSGFVLVANLPSPQGQ
ncbi:NLI interacting factor-like phosphatase [Rhizoctonia solani AG-1 IA]|uniref:NLI interacting factor-like phosphatase n=1 Tax=Thanatephorus cucumeris (strain AG1-IA) TaxID=983506 RepID=L8WYG1_THACA|nr:NLI interacting factor-like phosphatase [Rhizoctonia solani AG-1 IA]